MLIPGDNIKRLRTKAGLSQARLAELAGLKTIKAIERGRRGGRRSSLEGIARALGVTVSDLFKEPRRK